MWVCYYAVVTIVDVLYIVCAVRIQFRYHFDVIVLEQMFYAHSTACATLRPCMETPDCDVFDILECLWCDVSIVFHNANLVGHTYLSRHPTYGVLYVGGTVDWYYDSKHVDI